MSGENAPVPDSQSAFGDRFEVVTSQPLAEFSTYGGDAYTVNDKEKSGGEYYALVHNPTVPVRNEIYKSLTGKPIANLVCPVDRGLMNLVFDGRKRQRLVTIFSRPSGGALMDNSGNLNPRITASHLRQNVTLSVLKSITSLHKRGFVHRSIMPTNIYFASPNSDEVVLGECYSMPPGYMQPFAMEALPLALADPTSRGAGDASADYFQMGAALQALYFGEQLWNGRDRGSTLMARVNQGSFWALSGGREVPGALGALIRGVMADEVDERWGAEEVLDWFEGVGKPKRTTMRTWAMSRPTTFKGVAVVDRRLLADAFARDPKEAAAFLKSIDFSSWVQLSFRDEVLSERLENMINVKPDSGFGGVRADDYKMVARVCMFLHPHGPVNYKGYSFYLDGLSSMIAEAFSRDDREAISAIVEVMDIKFLQTLNDICDPHSKVIDQQIPYLRKFIEHASSKQLGRGMERVLYEMNSILPCLSQRFSNVWIGSIIQLMRALERIAIIGATRNILLDRHLAAFCATHGTDLEREFNALATAQHNPSKFNSLSMDFFGILQKRCNMEPLPHLTGKLVDGLSSAVKELKNKKRRERVQGLLEKGKKGGDITKLTSEVNMVRAQVEDAREFAQARTLIARLERERTKLSRKISPSDPDAQLKGMKGARLVAFVSGLLISFLTFF
ncbi:serine/threonine-protein kinase [Kordiimonas aquimaris]|uniref:hypothetical protein n=1 Tax=Kordiimonas aquimaris TaxID=707591 RepID=UPI0021D1094E|nr:hypothetical protein [Kordiimonas aquimaris]